MSNIKGGGRAIMSQDSQQALIELLMSLESSADETPLSELSKHEKRHARKKFLKRILHRHEQRQLQLKFNAKSSNDSNGGGSSRGASSSRTTYSTTATAAQPPTTTKSTNPNVRIELVEAIFPKSGKKSDTKKDNKKDKKKDPNSKNNDKTKKKNTNSNSSFKMGTKKIMVLPSSTTIDVLLKQSKAKLKLKKNPVRAFLQVVVESSGTTIFDLERDLQNLEDGSLVYISVTPLEKINMTEEREVQDKSEDDTGEEIDNDGTIIDPLESVKQAYRQQEVHRGMKQKRLERVEEVVDEEKRVAFFEQTRSKLPVYSHKQYILNAIEKNHVVVLSGATGSGKSTQVPQFLLESSSQDDFQQQKPYIVVTQPRKVAAISLAHRVAAERGCPPPGAKFSSVGYMVRSDRRVDFRSCRIIYMTIGILLRMLVGSGSISKRTNDCDEDEDNNDVVPPLSIETISHLIIDETHERDVNTDFSLTLLKGMMASSSQKEVPRLILMSATASSELFVSYFSTRDIQPVSIGVPGKTFPVDCKWLIDCETFTRQSMVTRKEGDKNAGSYDAISKIINSRGNQLSPRAMDKIDYRFIRSLIIEIVKKQQMSGVLDGSANESHRLTGAILIFLPGMGEIEALARCLHEEGTVASDRNLCRIMKLHSSVPKSEQERVFQLALIGTVKIVLATNIAETSVTIPDISHVIDSCRVKESRYNPSTRIKELVTVWTSLASMKQRAGRAGRTSRGTCWRLCSEEFANETLLPQTAPEMVRTPLDELILQILLLYEQRRDEHNNNLTNDDKVRLAFAPGAKPIKFLSMTPTPPSEHALSQACKHLLEVEALNVVDYGDSPSDEIGWMYRLTPLGYHLSRLPMDAKVGKMLIIGCILGCLDNALIIAAALSCTKSCFLSAFGFRGKFDPTFIEARDSLIENGFGGRDWPGGTVKGDLIAVIAAYRGWERENKSHKFCRAHALDNASFREMDTLRRQYLDLMVDAGLVSRPDHKNSLISDDCNIANEDALLTSCCLVAGLHPNIATLIRPQKGRGPKCGRLLTNESDGACRPSSNSFQKQRVQQASESGRDAYAVYHSKNRSIGTVSSAGQKRPPETFLSEVNFVSKFALLLFGGRTQLVKNAIVVDNWLKFKVSSDDEKDKHNAVLLLSLRETLDSVILEHVVETFSSQEEKSKMVERHNKVIEVVRNVLSDEG